MKKSKKWLATWALSGALLVAPLATEAAIFKDVKETEEYYATVEMLAEKGVLHTGTGYFNPHNELTRGQAAKIIVLAFDLPYETVTNTRFTDVPASAEFAPYIEAMAEAGIINGYADGTFKSEAKLTRGQMAKILVNVLKLEVITTYEQVFRDVPETNSYAPYIQQLAKLQITLGKSNGTYGVTETVKRSHFALFVGRSLRYEEHGYAYLPSLSVIGFKVVEDEKGGQPQVLPYTRVEAVRLSDGKVFPLKASNGSISYTGYLHDEGIYIVKYYLGDVLDLEGVARRSDTVIEKPLIALYNGGHSTQEGVVLNDPLGSSYQNNFQEIYETYELIKGEPQHVKIAELSKVTELTISAPGEYYFKATNKYGGDVYYLYVDVLEYNGQYHVYKQLVWF